ncbi:MAG: flippase [Muribaculaceae bacterium]|nr:flippase [Muribaculaceae bacterium]
MGLKKNVFFISILTTSNYVFPLLVYPYVSRVLGVTNIGLCNFIDNIINYFILVSMMGINLMGNRQMAADRARGISLTNSFSSLFTLNAISTFVVLGVLVCCTYTIPTLRENQQMMWYGAIRLVGNFMLIEWFYKGLEDFKYITYRTIFVKCLYVISIFIFIQSANDYTTYYLLTVLMVAVNAIINTVHSRKFVKFSFKGINLKVLIKPFFIIGIYFVVTSLCTSFTVVYLGFSTNDTQVGYYTTAIKLYSILLAFFTGVTSVIVPRMSSLLAQNKHDEFKGLLQKSTNLLFAFSIPVIIFTIVYAPDIILLISGPGYEGAITPMRIVMPMMLIIGLSQITVIQGLMPLKEDKTIMINASIGASVSVALNIILVPKLMSVGSAIAWVASEATILILSQIALNKIIKGKFPASKLLQSLVAYIPLALLLTILYFNLNINYWCDLIVSGVITGIYTIIVQYFVFKNPFLQQITNKFSKFFKKPNMSRA